MNRQEHELMLHLFAIQMQVSQTIWNLLKSRGVAEPDDAEPFAVMKQIPTLVQTYVELAHRLGVALPENFLRTI